MFVTLEGENYTANFYLFLVIYPLNHKENSEKFERQFQCCFKSSYIVGSIFKSLLTLSSIRINKGYLISLCAKISMHFFFTVGSFQILLQESF